MLHGARACTWVVGPTPQAQSGGQALSQRRAVAQFVNGKTVGHGWASLGERQGTMPKPRVGNSHKHGPGANNFQYERPFKFNHLVENKAP